jgi:F0F1-type ATP synthase membrane subunit b/b'
MRAEWQRRLERLGGELEAMLAQARTDIAKERDQILEAARQSAEAIHRDAQRTADNELRSAQEILRAEVAKQALAIAERLAAQRLTAADQQRFVAEFVAQVHDR